MANGITIKFDFSRFGQGSKKTLALLSNPAYLLRPVAIELIPLMTRRIHINGKAADGTPIGKYAASYMKVRKKHKRTEPQNKVVISLTSQLENEWAVVPLPEKKGYGIGFLSPLSANKAKWVEEHFNKKIFQLSDSEQKFATQRLNELINDAFNR